MTRAELNTYINTNITDKTAIDSLTPADEGNALKEVSDYIDQQDDLKENLSNKSTDVTTDGASNTKYPSVKSVKDYADGLVVGLLDDRGNYDASTNLFPASGGSGTAGAVMKGDLWYISVTGTLGGETASVGASVRALSDAPGQTSANWDILNVGLGFTPENVANKSTDVAIDGASDTKYPSVKAVKDYVDANSGGIQVTKTIKVILSAAEILALDSTPIEILPAAVGKIYIPRFLFQNYTYVSINYASSSILRFAYDTPSIWTAQAGLFTPNFNPGQALTTLSMNTNTQGFTYSGKKLLMFLTSQMFDGNGTTELYITYDEFTL